MRNPNRVLWDYGIPKESGNACDVDVERCPQNFPDVILNLDGYCFEFRATEPDNPLQIGAVRRRECRKKLFSCEVRVIVDPGVFSPSLSDSLGETFTNSKSRLSGQRL